MAPDGARRRGCVEAGPVLQGDKEIVGRFAETLGGPSFSRTVHRTTEAIGALHARQCGECSGLFGSVWLQAVAEKKGPPIQLLSLAAATAARRATFALCQRVVMRESCIGRE